MVRGSIKMRLESQHRDEVLQVLKKLVGPTASDPNCTLCDAYINAWDSEEVVFVTEWTERQHLDVYLASEPCRTILSAMDLSFAPPEVRIECVSDCAGLEYIAALRQDNKPQTTKNSEAMS